MSLADTFEVLTCEWCKKRFVAKRRSWPRTICRCGACRHQGKARHYEELALKHRQQAASKRESQKRGLAKFERLTQQPIAEDSE